jgi:glycosyltransferase involved in cell wall biosynthesis
MRILVLAPQPFYQERGTPIAVKLAVENIAKILSSKVSNPYNPQVDLLVYDEGLDISIEGVRILRSKIPSLFSGIRPGISLKKLVCDLFFCLSTFRLIRAAKKDHSRGYDLIHAVEESVFIAWVAKKLFKIPYIYDMDSSLAMQVTEKWWWCKPLLSIFRLLEGAAIRGSISVAPVCDALKILAERNGSTSTVLLRDISLLPSSQVECRGNKREVFGTQLSDKNPIILYVGNLEPYQGIDLLIGAFSELGEAHPDARLVIVGGSSASIEAYRLKAKQRGAHDRIIFLGARPVDELANLLKAADILASPRIKGNNTPMKIYSYLHSGTPLIATDLPTHRQVLNPNIALLVEPQVHPFAQGLHRLLIEREFAAGLGRCAQETAERLYTANAFEKQIAKLYSEVAEALKG